MSLQLTPPEVTIIQMALTTLIETINEASKDPTIPWTPEARKINAEMLSTAQVALAKIATISGHLVQLDPYTPGDEKEFLTKQS